MTYFTGVKQGVHASGTHMDATASLTAADKNVKSKGPRTKSKPHSPLAAKTRRKQRLPR